MKTITIAGIQFTVPQPYAAGHTVTEGEAAALNQTFAENIRNNMAKKVKDGSADQAAITEYAAGYTFTVAGVGASTSARVTDPVEREARRLAKVYITGVLKERGTTIKKYYGDDEAGLAKLEEKITELMAKDAIWKEAEKEVKRNAKRGEELRKALSFEGDEAAAA